VGSPSLRANGSQGRSPDMHIIPAARCARGLLFRPLRKRAQGKPGARCTRGLACKIVQKSAHEHTGSAEAVRPSLRNGFNGFLRALPGDRAFLSPSPAKTCFRELDASVEASGPHDFAVRIQRRSSKAPSASTASRPTSVTIASAPHEERDGGGDRVICDFGKAEYFFGRGLTGGRVICPSGAGVASGYVYSARGAG
jgi:hypothetical protein